MEQIARILETKRLVLRYLSEGDIDFAVKLWLDPDMTRYTGGPRERGFLETEFSKAVADPCAEEYDLWMVERKDTGERIGQAGFIPKEIDGEEYMELNYYIWKAHWGRGYATEMAEALRDYGFKAKGLATLIAVIDEENAASRRVAEKIGMRVWKKSTRNDVEKVIYRGTAAQ